MEGGMGSDGGAAMGGSVRAAAEEGGVARADRDAICMPAGRGRRGGGQEGDRERAERRGRETSGERGAAAGAAGGKEGNKAPKRGGGGSRKGNAAVVQCAVLAGGGGNERMGGGGMVLGGVHPAGAVDAGGDDDMGGSGCDMPGPSGSDHICGSSEDDNGCGCGMPGPSGCDHVCAAVVQCATLAGGGDNERTGGEGMVQGGVQPVVAVEAVFPAEGACAIDPADAMAPDGVGETTGAGAEGGTETRRRAPPQGALE